METDKTITNFEVLQDHQMIIDDVKDIRSDGIKPLRGGKLPRIKRTSNSYRPGNQLTFATVHPMVKPHELHFIIPASGRMANNDEAGRVQRIAEQIDNLTNLGEVTTISLKNSTWLIVLTVSNTDNHDPDDLLSNTFRMLMPVVENLTELKSGFLPGKVASWKFMIGAHTIDDGGWN